MDKQMTVKPLAGEIEEASHHPNGWVYRIAASVGDPNGSVPPEAIVGAWKIDAKGKIVGDFVPNPKYDAAKWPSKPNWDATDNRTGTHERHHKHHRPRDPR